MACASQPRKWVVEEQVTEEREFLKSENIAYIEDNESQFCQRLRRGKARKNTEV